MMYDSVFYHIYIYIKETRIRKICCYASNINCMSWLARPYCTSLLERRIHTPPILEHFRLLVEYHTFVQNL